MGLEDRVRKAEARTKQQEEEAWRQEIATHVANDLVRAICSIFTRVNTLGDPEERKRQFAIDTDNFIDNYLDKAGLVKSYDVRFK